MTFPKYLLWILSSTSLLHLTLNCSYFLKSRFNIIYKYGCVWPVYVSVLNLCVCMCITYVCFCMFVCVTCVCICVYVKCVWTVYVCIYLWTMHKCAWPVCMWVCTGGREEQRVLCVSFYESEEDLRLFGAVVMEDCVLPNVCDGNWILVLWQSSKPPNMEPFLELLDCSAQKQTQSL